MSDLQSTAGPGLVRDLLQRADSQARGGNTAAAVDLLGQAWQASRTTEGDAFRASCCRGLAKLYYVLGRRELAEQHRQRALAAELRERGGPSGVSLWLAACAARERGECKAAARLLAASLECEPAPPRGDVLAEWGRLSHACGDLPRAIRLLRRSARLLTRDGDTFAAARALVDLGTVCCEDQRYRAASKALRAAAVRFRSMGRTQDARRAISAARRADRLRRVLKLAAERN